MDRTVYLGEMEACHLSCHLSCPVMSCHFPKENPGKNDGVCRYCRLAIVVEVVVVVVVVVVAVVVGGWDCAQYNYGQEERKRKIRSRCMKDLSS